MVYYSKQEIAGSLSFRACREIPFYLEERDPSTLVGMTAKIINNS